MHIANSLGIMSGDVGRVVASEMMGREKCRSDPCRRRIMLLGGGERVCRRGVRWGCVKGVWMWVIGGDVG